MYPAHQMSPQISLACQRQVAHWSGPPHKTCPLNTPAARGLEEYISAVLERFLQPIYALRASEELWQEHDTIYCIAY